jgi:hypothetical protein
MGGPTIMVPLTCLLGPWETDPSSPDSGSSTRCHQSPYLMIRRISSSILSGPTFPTLVFSRNESKRVSYRRFPSRTPIDRGRVMVAVIWTFHASSRTSSNAGQCRSTWVVVIFAGPHGWHVSSQNQHRAESHFPILLRYTPDSKWFVRSWEANLASLFRALSTALFFAGSAIIVNFPRLCRSMFAAVVYVLEIFSLIQAIDPWCCPLGRWLSAAWPER